MVRITQRHPVFERVDTLSTESFVWRCDDYPWKRNVWNTHPEYEIHLIRNASGVALVGDHIGRFEPGYLAVVGGGLPHDWVSQLTPGEIIQSRDIVLQFDPDRLRRAAVALPELAHFEPFLQRARRGLLYLGETRHDGAGILEQMATAAGLRRVVLLMQLLQLLADSDEYEILSSEGFAPNLDPATLDIIQLALNFLVRNSASDVKLADVARIAGMSETAFSRFFKKNTGNSFTDHLTKLRIGHACKLLAETAMPITDVCFGVGYENVSNFNRIFRQQRGITPSIYRRLSQQRRT